MIALALVLGGLGAVALFVLVLPVLRSGPALPGRGRYDSAVYRDQLAELERDVARGLIGAAEAQSARLEIERRLLAADAAAPDGAAASRRSPVLAVVLAVLVAGGAAGLYLRLGAPEVPDTSYALRVASHGAATGVPNHPDMGKLAAQLADKLHADPNNREGWELYARTLATMGNWQGSADAWRELIALGGAGADAYAGYGEMLVLGSEGVVTPAAREAFGEALKADASNPIARFYLALADAQAGRGQQALAAWVKLAGEVADADMRSEIARRIAETAKLSGLPAPAMPPAPAVAAEQQPEPAAAEAAAEPVAGSVPGLDAAQMATAANMSEADRATMIKGMVAQLAAKLAAEPNDADGWVRLGRAYAVLAEHDKAADAYERAAALRPGDVSVLVQGVQALIEAQKPDAPIPRRAIDLLHQAERIAPNQPEVLWYLGLAEAQAGHIDAAQTYWRRVLNALPPDSPDRKMVSNAINNLKKE